jgi:hypothetical protein
MIKAMLRRVLLASIWSVMMLKGNLSNAQISADLPPSPHPNIRIVRLSQEHVIFPTILQSAVSAPIYNTSFVIHNDDKRNIVAIFAEWTIKDASGNVSKTILLSDIFTSTLKNSVIPPGKALIITPKGWINPSVYTKIQSTGANPEAKYASGPAADRILHAAAISLSIDSMVFDDGQISGINSNRIDQIIIARKTAAESISKQVRASMNSGGYWKGYLTALQASPQTSDMGSQSYWEHHFSDELLWFRRDPLMLINYYENLPVPIAFHQ